MKDSRLQLEVIGSLHGEKIDKGKLISVQSDRKSKRREIIQKEPLKREIKKGRGEL